MKNQKGIGVNKRLLIILVIVGMLGFIGWYAWYSNSNSNRNTSTYANYLDIKDWGVRLSFDDADKVTYKVMTENTGTQVANLYLKDSVTSNKSCKALGVGLSRAMKNIDGDNKIKIGNYYYQIGGGPSDCEGYKSGISASIYQLRTKIDGQELGSGRYTLTLIR